MWIIILAILIAVFLFVGGVIDTSPKIKRPKLTDEDRKAADRARNNIDFND